MILRALFLVSVTLSSILTASAEQLHVPELTLAPGASATVEISLDNEHSDLVAFQMDLALPEGLSIDKAGCFLTSRITDEQQELVIGKLESGAFRLTSTSMSLTPISGTGGPLLSLKINLDESFVQGTVTIGNIRFSTSSSERVTLDDVSFTINTHYTLTYIVDGEVYKTSTVAYGTELTPEAEPTKEGYVFSGWNDLPATMPARDVTVTGTFTPGSYNVTFQYGDSILTTTKVEYGAVIPLPESLDSDRYTLVEWLDVPATMPAHDITIYADFTDGVKAIRGNTIDTEYYLLNGVKRNALQRGLNILRMSDGTTRKVLIK